MSELVWDDVGTRTYETGLDKGVLYLPSGAAVPWNGLVSIVEKFDKSVSPVYYDGMKIVDYVSLGDFAASMKAITYPDEFLEIEGLGKARGGLFLGDQRPQSFGLSYRTQVGNDVEGDVSGYKIHVLYNLTAIPNDKSYMTVAGGTSPTEFEWDITAVPEEFAGYRPTAQIIIKTADLEPFVLQGLEDMLYGSPTTTPYLPPMLDLITYLTETYVIEIVDNGDGTWTATAALPGYITFLDTDLFQISSPDASFLNATTYVISSTLDV